MRVSYVSVVVAASPLALAAHAPSDRLSSRNEDACDNVQEIVELLEQRHATTFCRSFLGITPITVTATTKTKSKTDIVTSTTTISTTVTTTWTTFPLTTTTRYVPVGLSTTFLRTTTVPLTETTTVTTPGTGTQTVTTYYTPSPGAKKRRAVKAGDVQEDLKARNNGNNIPGYLKSYPTPSISQACSCLSIPTPTITQRVVFTTTTTKTKTKSTTTTETQSAYIRPISRTTFFYTQIVPGVSTSYTTITTATQTTFSPPYAVTATVSLPLPSECINIGSGGKLYDTLVQGPQLYNMIGYDIAATPGEQLRSICCNDCYLKRDCMYWRVVATTFCRLYSRIEPAEDPGTVSEQCPFGSGSETLLDPILDPLPDNPGFGKGPCL